MPLHPESPRPFYLPSACASVISRIQDALAVGARLEGLVVVESKGEIDYKKSHLIFETIAPVTSPKPWHGMFLCRYSPDIICDTLPDSVQTSIGAGMGVRLLALIGKLVPETGSWTLRSYLCPGEYLHSLVGSDGVFQDPKATLIANCLSFHLLPVTLPRAVL